MLEFLLGLFVFGTLSFWVLLAGALVLLVWITEEHKDAIGTVIVLALVWVFASANHLSVWAHPTVWLKWLAAYMLIGAAWSILKWVSYLYQMKDRLKDLKADFVREHNLVLVNGKIPEASIQYFLGYINDRGYSPNGKYGKLRTLGEVVPTVKGQAANLTRWIVWWPFSAVWTILNDPLRRLARAIVRLFRGVYTKIATLVFSSEI